MEENKKINFDLKELNKKQLVDTYTNINDFINFLTEGIIQEEEENEDE